ncbi:MAG: helix-turn-helix transcriptional regulator [Oscillospiraceae bacterium]|nr:helix-turn-helix transcriptional regulator [Oscillospiraceae bacterium]
MEQKIQRDRNMGSNLRRLRKEAHLSQEKICAELQRRGCDIGRTTYEKYESDELNIRASVLIALRKIYNCTYDDFFQGLDQIHSIKERSNPKGLLRSFMLCMNHYVFAFAVLIDAISSFLISRQSERSDFPSASVR